MGRLIIVAGASGAGKSFLLESISCLDSSIVPVKKLTTRDPRPYETKQRRLFLDLVFSKRKPTVTRGDYVYYYGGAWYGTRKADIDAVLGAGQNPILIVRDCEAIYKIMRDFPEALVLYLQSGLSGEDLEKKLKEQGRGDIDIESRMERLKADFRNYVAHLDLFHHVLVNYYDEESLMEQMRTILRHELPQDTTIPDFVFVLIPFKSSFRNVYAAIRTSGRLLNGRPLRIERIDEKRGVYAITPEILRSIRQAALVIADLSEPNPNVYFEYGYAVGIGKKVLPCARKGTELPFDAKDRHTVFYDNAIDLQEKFSEQFRQIFPHFVKRPGRRA